MASELSQICSTILSDVNDALGAALVDLNSGLLLAVEHHVPYFTQTYIDAVAAAAVDMFCGKTVSTVEQMLSAQRNKTVSRMIQEVQMTTERTYHFMSIVPGRPDCLFVLITGKKTNLGMGWSTLRAALPKIAPHCP